MQSTKSKKPVWILLAVALAAHSILISSQVNNRFDTSFVRVWLLEGLAPFEKFVDGSVNGIAGLWNGYIALIGVQGENNQLRAENDELRMELDRRAEDIREAARLRELLGLQEAGYGRSVTARVIGRDPTQSHQTLTIDRGSSDGVLRDAAVITPQGIVGRVIESSRNYAIVELILDSQSAVGVMLESTRQQAILKGTGSRELVLDYIDDDNSVVEGDRFITSGTDRIYPKGLPVGVISSVGPRRGLFKEVSIRPLADLSRLEEVLCFIDRPTLDDDSMPEIDSSPSP